MTQYQQARKNKFTKEMKAVAKKEGIDPAILRDGISKGLVVIPANKNHKHIDPIGIGKGLQVKVNANRFTPH